MSDVSLRISEGQEMRVRKGAQCLDHRMMGGWEGTTVTVLDTSILITGKVLVLAGPVDASTYTPARAADRQFVYFTDLEPLA